MMATRAQLEQELGVLWGILSNNDITIAELTAENAALKAQLPREGWQLVPISPTPEMIEAGNDGFRNPDSRRHTVSSCYKAMLAAAPQPEGAP